MKALIWLGCLVSLLAAASVQAAVTATDLQVAARALSFMEQPLRGTVRVGIVYSNASPASHRQAEEVERLLGSGLRAGNLELHAVMVELGEHKSADVDLFLLTEHVTAEQAQLAGLGADRRTLCVTTDLEQVRNGSCVMGVRSAPKVEILVNRVAAQARGLSFATVFRVMITEI